MHSRCLLFLIGTWGWDSRPLTPHLSTSAAGGEVIIRSYRISLLCQVQEELISSLSHNQIHR